ncbi:MAG: Rieske 2Fe-2S domain-containing protein [Actinobacteria bacterium]|nr:Rieske 2Fe-2S domain-containing protein [Actinomycetota bacterium]
MQRQAFVELSRRLLAHATAGTTDLAATTYSVSVADYADPDRWQAEMDRIFRRVPLVLALAGELPEPGSYKVTWVLGTPVLLTRGDDGAARAFVDVCRHRGAVVTPEGCGRARRHTCPYHGWTYDTNGALVGIPGREGFHELDVASHGLVPLACGERAGLVFACITPGVAIDLDEWLSGYDEVLEPFGMGRWHLVSRREVDGANWKIVYDGYLEGYHFGSLHRDTLFGAFMSNVMAYDAWGPHQRVGFARHGIERLRDKPESEWGDQEGIGLVCTVFPSVSFAFLPAGVLMSQLFPGPTPDRSRTVQSIFWDHEPSEPEQTDIEGIAEMLFGVVRDEDYATGAGIQRALSSGANTEFVFGRNELGLHRFHQTVARLLTSERV